MGTWNFFSDYKTSTNKTEVKTKEGRQKRSYRERMPFKRKTAMVPSLQGTLQHYIRWNEDSLYAIRDYMTRGDKDFLSDKELDIWNKFVEFQDTMTSSPSIQQKGCTIKDKFLYSYPVLEDNSIDFDDICSGAKHVDFDTYVVQSLDKILVEMVKSGTKDIDTKEIVGILPKMNSNIDKGFEWTESSYYNTDNKAFQLTSEVYTDNVWWSSTSNSDSWARVKLDKPYKIKSFMIVGRNNQLNRNPIEYRLEGANDDLTWEILGSYTKTDWTTSERVDHVVNSSKEYQYIRIFCIRSESGNIGLDGMQLYYEQIIEGEISPETELLKDEIEFPLEDLECVKTLFLELDERGIVDNGYMDIPEIPDIKKSTKPELSRFMTKTSSSRKNKVYCVGGLRATFEPCSDTQTVEIEVVDTLAGIDMKENKTFFFDKEKLAILYSVTPLSTQEDTSTEWLILGFNEEFNSWDKLDKRSIVEGWLDSNPRVFEIEYPRHYKKIRIRFNDNKEVSEVKFFDRTLSIPKTSIVTAQADCSKDETLLSVKVLSAQIQ